MTLTEFVDEMNRIIPPEPNRSLDVSVEAVHELFRAAADAQPEEELRRLLRERGLRNAGSSGCTSAAADADTRERLTADRDMRFRMP